MIGGGAGAPTVASAAELGTRPPVSVASATPNDRGVVPGVSAAGISFPDWGPSFGFEAVGVRRDHLGDRLATTVFYARDDQRIAYTILSGLAVPAGAALRQSVWDGVQIGSFLSHGRVVVTWLRNGHTCVLSGADTPAALLARMASYKTAEPSSDEPSAAS
jgi:hypothetical protein